MKYISRSYLLLEMDSFLRIKTVITYDTYHAALVPWFYSQKSKFLHLSSRFPPPDLKYEVILLLTLIISLI